MKQFPFALMIVFWVTIAGGFLPVYAAPPVPPPTMSGESLTGVPTVDPSECSDPANGSFAYTIEGQAFGPYPGTFTERGSFSFQDEPPAGPRVIAFSADFTIISGTTSITGTKTLAPGAYYGVCYQYGAAGVEATYDAIISTADGFYHDEGTTVVSFDAGVYAVEYFTSALTETVPATPVSKEQCKDGGWRFLVRADGTRFNNQGECIRYFNTGN